MKQSKIINIIVAAGSGSRFGASLPKQFCPLNGRPVLMHTIEKMQLALPGSTTIVVLNKDFVSYWSELCEKHNFISPQIAIGGDTRWQSVKNALDTISSTVDNDTIITVHDGARPIIEAQMINRTIEAAKVHSGSIPAIAITDSIRQILPNGSSTPANRSFFKAVQTPQAFNGLTLLKAYACGYKPEYTDDASVLAEAGYDDIVLVEGSPTNIKITHPHDIEIAKIYLNHK